LAIVDLISDPAAALNVFEFEEVAHRKMWQAHWAFMASGVDDDATLRANLLLAQPSIGSQLVDNLNASSHLRAVLTDLFLLGKVLKI